MQCGGLNIKLSVLPIAVLMGVFTAFVVLQAFANESGPLHWLSLLVAGLAARYSFLFNGISWGAAGLLLVLASFGIYLGRYIRFNSWDVKHPVQFVKKLREHFRPAGSVKNCGLFVLFHSLFFIVF